MKSFSALLFFSAIMLVSHAPAKENGSQAPVLPESRAKIFTLENGLTLIVEEDHSAPVASVQAWCGTGSIHEGRWLGAGLSHILEHMLFKGTETRQAGDIARQVQEQGGYINAYTSFDRTVYWIDVPASGAGEAVAILADAMMNATLPEDEYLKEQEVIRREFAMGFDDPDRQSSQLMLRTVFSESPFRHPVIGYLDIYNKLTRDDVMRYYKERYVPNNLTFVVTGDVNADAIHEQLVKFFEKYPRRALEPVLVATEPEQVGRRDVAEEFPTELSRLSLAWRVPGLTDPDTPALELLGMVLGSGRSSLLNQQIREKLKLAHSVEAGVYSLQTDGAFIIEALCDPDRRDAVEKEVLALLRQVKKDGVQPQQLEKARRLLLSQQISTLATARGRASDLGSNWLLTKNLNFSKDYLAAISRVTPEDLQRVANRYLSEDKMNVSSLNPIGSLAKARQEKPAIARSDVQKFTLSNGLRLLVREDARLPLVSLFATFRGGLLAETPENNGVTRLLSRTMLKGTAGRSASKIAEQIEGAGGRIAADNGNNSFSVAAEVLKPDLALGLDILADVVQNPSFPEAEVALEKAAQIAAIKAEEEQITAVARNTAREKLFGAHPYALRATGSIAAVEKLSAQDLRAVHQELATAKNGVLAVFGDVNAQEVLKLVEKDFGKMPAGRLALTEPPQPAPLSQAIDSVEERDKQQAVVMVTYPGANVMSGDRAALELLDEASNDLGSRFFNRIREKLGLAYFVGARNFAGLAPGYFTFYLGTDPQKVEKVTGEFQDEISKLAKDGLTAEELARAKKKLLGAEAIQNQSNAAFASKTATDELVGLGYGRYKDRTREIEAVTLEDVKRVAGKYFNQPGYVQVTVRPPLKAAAQQSPPPQS